MRNLTSCFIILLYLLSICWAFKLRFKKNGKVISIRPSSVPLTGRNVRNVNIRNVNHNSKGLSHNRQKIPPVIEHMRYTEANEAGNVVYSLWLHNMNDVARLLRNRFGVNIDVVEPRLQYNLDFDT